MKGLQSGLAAFLATCQFAAFAFVADVTKFGAKGDGWTDDTAAVQRAIDTVAAAGGGKVYLPYTTNGYLIASPGRETDAEGRPVRAQLIIPAGSATIGFEGGQTTELPPYVSHLKNGIYDPGNRLHGSISWHEPWGANTFPVVGAKHFRIRRFGE